MSAGTATDTAPTKKRRAANWKTCTATEGECNRADFRALADHIGHFGVLTVLAELIVQQEDEEGRRCSMDDAFKDIVRSISWLRRVV